jgi:hypothetical protein
MRGSSVLILVASALTLPFIGMKAASQRPSSLSTGVAAPTPAAWPLAEERYKNIPLFKGVPADRRRSGV